MKHHTRKTPSRMPFRQSCTSTNKPLRLGRSLSVVSDSTATRRPGRLPKSVCEQRQAQRGIPVFISSDDLRRFVLEAIERHVRRTRLVQLRAWLTDDESVRHCQQAHNNGLLFIPSPKQALRNAIGDRPPATTPLLRSRAVHGFRSRWRIRIQAFYTSVRRPPHHIFDRGDEFRSLHFSQLLSNLYRENSHEDL